MDKPIHIYECVCRLFSTWCLVGIEYKLILKPLKQLTSRKIWIWNVSVTASSSTAFHLSSIFISTSLLLVVVFTVDPTEPFHIKSNPIGSSLWHFRTSECSQSPYICTGQPPPATVIFLMMLLLLPLLATGRTMRWSRAEESCWPIIIGPSEESRSTAAMKSRKMPWVRNDRINVHRMYICIHVCLNSIFTPINTE